MTSAGKVYAAKLAEFMKKLYPPSSSRGSGSGSGVGGVENEELVVWTSTMLRTGQTVAPMTFDREVGILAGISPGGEDRFKLETLRKQPGTSYTS